MCILCYLTPPFHIQCEALQPHVIPLVQRLLDDGGYGSGFGFGCGCVRELVACVG